ncbi:sodium- and chloride-dependent neutral and basic amino acid transporter B(0+) [Brachionus plicatilis]|uniref:Transporter n=1 Tax=Brachionus plicatilis TaxID=10195 RepID=A0A3M7QUH8_BRAPC|nr:sodium- and chloride-dependent neutral and basic amino acid transporter B(0+) [Brachionus plicatilis]
MSKIESKEKEFDQVSEITVASQELDAWSETEEHRETWNGKFDFFLSALGYAVGLGAIWRFPYLCYRNGGGVFLIPFFFFLFLVGIPLVFLELGVGQFTSTGPLTCWQMVPLFRGIGLSMNIVNAYLSIFYNMIIAYSLYFLVLSFNSKLPWEECNPQWSSPNCVDDYSPDKFTFTNCMNSSLYLKCSNGKCFDINSLDGRIADCNMNETLLQMVGWWNPTFPSQDYWNKVVLKKSSGIEETGVIVWQLAVALAIAWVGVYAMVIKGIHATGKIVYFTATFPYLVLLILGIRGWLLPGAGKGIEFYIYPDFSKLSDVNVWYDAASQIFFTLSVSYGGLVALSSYNKFNNNILRDSIVVSISNCLTSVFAGFVVFSFIGYLSHVTGQDINDVIQAGQGLSFVVFPYAATTITGAPFWAALFFVMMLVLGLDTMMASVETAITSILDAFPSLKKNAFRRYLSITIICLVFFLIGLIFTTQAGTYWIEIFNNYAGGWAVIFIGAFEAISVSWFYGFGNFKTDIELMIGKRFTKYKIFYIWNIFWAVITPGILLLDDYTFPYWSHVLGEIMTSLTLAGTVLWALWLPLSSLIKPDFESWRPKKGYHYDEMLVAHGLQPRKRSSRKNLQAFENISYNEESRF